ncbi:MAG: putative baseplate assembly protein [Chloroflexi bacterium]|nr:putative baseplate assembly protein [Chloroflexota bacterium]
MALPTRSLDDRSFQDLVDEAKKKIPLYCPEWTDHNVSDPGITLIELFAWMADILLYRMNQVPTKHYVKLLELLGIQLQPPNAAVAPLTFYLSAPQPQAVTIPRGSAVATSRVDNREAVVFTTDEDVTIKPAKLTHIVLRRRQADGSMRFEEVGLQRLSKEFNPFSPHPPQVDEALLLGFDEPYDRHVLGLDFTCVRAGGQNIIPENPPTRWQAWSQEAWVDLDVEEDGTGGMSWSGQVRLHLPVMAKREVNEIQAYWVRCEVTAPKGEQRPYTTSPIVREVKAVSWGATIDATHAMEVTNEPLGRSDASPGQVYHLEHTPVLPCRPEERVEIWSGGMDDWEPWLQVEDFGESGPEDKHYTLDSASGEICFGPAIRQRDGAVRRYGAIPPRGADIRIASYRYGGGMTGNVRAGAITEAKTPFAYIDHVINRRPALGGLDPETLEQAMFRARNLLRTRGRAVTAEDYEYLATHAFSGEVARALCLQTRAGGGKGGAPSPGQVYVMVVPQLAEQEAARYIPLSRLALSDNLKQRLTNYLDERRLLTTQLEVRSAGYKRVRTVVEAVAKPGADEERLRKDIISALELFINPLRGGPEGCGWPFGRELYLSDLYACVQHVSGLQYVQNIDMFWVDEGDVLHKIERKLDLLAHEVLASDIHEVKISLE